MSRYRNKLPQLSGGLFLTDAGLETDLIFNHGIEIREFAAHTLLPNPRGRESVANYLRGFLSLANKYNTGFVLDSQTWKAHLHWAEDLAATEQELHETNKDASVFIAELRDECAGNNKPIVLNVVTGLRGDVYAPGTRMAGCEEEDCTATQNGCGAETEVDMVTALTFTQSDEAIGVVRAAQAAGLPAVISFTVETDGRLPTGQPLSEAIGAVDEATDGAAAYFMVNCAHPDHFFDVLDDSAWARRIRGLRCNASRLSHEELDECEVLDDGDPVELANQYKAITTTMPWLNVLGGCCGSDLRHVDRIAMAVSG